MTTSPLEAALTKHLCALGWTPGKYAAIGQKTYQTAVGPKVAHVYVQDFGPENACVILAGEYRSEGRNILEPHGVMVPRAADDEALAELAAKFAAQADAVVGQSYAARLLREAP